MATPIDFNEANAFCPRPDQEPYPVWVRESMLGQTKTAEVISLWQLSPEELTAVNESGIVFLRVVGGQPPVEVIYGDPTEFEGQNAVYTHPDCRDLPVYKREITHNGKLTIDVTSAWALNPVGRNTVRQTGIVYLRVVGGQPDLEVFGINPVIE